MPSTSLPEPAVVPAAPALDEVVEVFQGDTLEEAMADAVAALGPGLAVRRARKVRAGVRGLLGRDRYEVLAVPGPGGPAPAPASSSGDVVGDALGALLSAADQREAATPVTREAPPVAGAPPAPAPAALPRAPRALVGRRRAVPAQPAIEAVPDVGPGSAVAAPDAPAGPLGDQAPQAPQAPHPDPEVADHPELPRARPRRRRGAGPTTAAEVGAEAEVVAEPTVPTAPVPAAAAARPAGQRGTAARRARTAGWSRASLSSLGVPTAVLDRLPEAEPTDDLGWVVALTAAIDAAVPAPHEPDADHPVVVSGHGLAGAVAVLDAGCRGLVPGTISHAGRTAPATATELALVLRHHVTDRGA